MLSCEWCEHNCSVVEILLLSDEIIFSWDTSLWVDQGQHHCYYQLSSEDWAQNIRILFEDQSQRGVKCFIRYLRTLFDKMDTMLILVWSWCLTLSYHGSQVWCSRGLQHCEEHFHVLCGNSEQCRPRLSVYNALILDCWCRIFPFFLCLN